ncbi:hypothetical protein GJAV_G00024430 [Gymnothorax javanicus]|nr:hypothetical protein GJAV_G00024430 [Gymnothorax javanicus]
MRSASYSQTLAVSGSSRMRVQSPSPSRCRTSSRSRGRSGFSGAAVEVATEIHQQVQTDEKQQMKELNARFAGYIGKVHALEQRNAALKAQLEDLRARDKGAPGPEYELQFKELKQLIERLTNEKGAADIERGYIEEDIAIWRLKLDEDLALKEEAEMILLEFRQDVDNATLQKAELEKHAEQLVAEIEMMKKFHAETVEDLLRQIEDAKVSVKLEEDRPDLAAYLRSIRAEIEAVAGRNVVEAEKWYKGKFEALKEQAGKHEIQMKCMQEQVTVLHSQITDLQNQIDGLRSRNEVLELQLQEMEVNHLDKTAGMQQVIAQLECELAETKSEMSKYLLDYKELLHIKLKLDTEIATYRMLLEGEEKRLETCEVKSMSKTG